MAVRLFVRHPVTDYATWRKAYDAFDSERVPMGVIGDAVYRSVDDPNDVTVYHDFATVEKAKAFAASPRLRDVMAEGASPLPRRSGSSSRTEEVSVPSERRRDPLDGPRGNRTSALDPQTPVRRSASVGSSYRREAPALERAGIHVHDGLITRPQGSSDSSRASSSGQQDRRGASAGPTSHTSRGAVIGAR